MRKPDMFTRGLIVVAAITACAVEQSSTGPKVGMDAMLAKGGGQSGSFVSLAGGLETAIRQPVSVVSSDGSWRLQGGNPFLAAVTMSATNSAGTSSCGPGDYGFEGNETIKTELLQLLLDASQHRRVFQATSGIGIVVVWDEADGRALTFKIQHSTISQNGNVYTYTGGSVYILRSNGQKGKAQVKHDMICPNLDPVFLTYPA